MEMQSFDLKIDLECDDVGSDGTNNNNIESREMDARNGSTTQTIDPGRIHRIRIIRRSVRTRRFVCGTWKCGANRK